MASIAEAHSPAARVNVNKESNYQPRSTPLDLLSATFGRNPSIGIHRLQHCPQSAKAKLGHRQKVDKTKPPKDNPDGQPKYVLIASDHHRATIRSYLTEAAWTAVLVTACGWLGAASNALGACPLVHR